MFRILSISIDLISSAIIILPAFLLLNRTLLHEKSQLRRALYVLLALYLSAVFSVTGIPSLTSLHLNPSFNLIPLIDIRNSPVDYIKNTLLNILLFIPFGFFLPLLWEEFRQLKSCIICGFCLSLGIEVLQIFTFRLTDIDDLITNTLGTLLGFFLSKLFARISVIPGSQDTGQGKVTLLLITGTIFVLHFTILPFLSGWFWELAY